ncbi:MAG: trypsin-like serine protease [Pseudoxanthomonas sp.]
MARSARCNPMLDGAGHFALFLGMLLMSGCRDSGTDVPPASAPPTATTNPPAPDDGGPSHLTSGPSGRDYAHPWVVRVTGNLTCHGTVIHPRWVLTAAHCVTTGTTASNGVRKILRVEYSRIDPAGTSQTDKREFANGGASQVILHPDFRLGSEEHDIALVRLPTPFVIGPGLQTAAIPAGPRTSAVVGTVATYNRSGLQPGQLGLFRGSIPVGAGPSFTVLRTNPADALDEGDSGSGIVSQENERAVVRGVASLGGANRDPSFTDVAAHAAWILGQLGTSPDLLAGFTRVARRGKAADGVMTLDCPNTYGAMSGPMYADGAALGASCTAGQMQRVECTATRALDGGVVARPFGITEFSMRTSCLPNAPVVQQLAHGQNQAVFNGPAAQSPDPVGICIREFTCRVGPVSPVLTQ